MNSRLLIFLTCLLLSCSLFIVQCQQQSEHSDPIAPSCQVDWTGDWYDLGRHEQETGTPLGYWNEEKGPLGKITILKNGASLSTSPDSVVSFTATINSQYYWLAQGFITSNNYQMGVMNGGMNCQRIGGNYMDTNLGKQIQWAAQRLSIPTDST